MSDSAAVWLLRAIAVGVVLEVVLAVLACACLVMWVRQRAAERRRTRTLVRARRARAARAATAQPGAGRWVAEGGVRVYERWPGAGARR